MEEHQDHQPCHFTLNQWPLETPVLIRYGQLTSDEYFVSAGAAREGVHIYQETAAGNTAQVH